MSLETAFAQMGAKVRVRDDAGTNPRLNRVLRRFPEADYAFRRGPVPLGWRSGLRRSTAVARTVRANRGNPTLDVTNIKGQETFDIELNGAHAEVLQVEPKDRHLLLMFKTVDGTKSKFLCGHDERHWFAAAVPESAPAGTVAQAKEALQPTVVRERAARLPRAERLRRHNEAYKRQGEWFFLPVENPQVDEKMVRRNEPLTRGRGKPHMAEYLYRTGGQTVYVGRTGTDRTQRVLSQEQYNALPEKDRKIAWNVQRRDMDVLVKGAIRHPDHATLVLDGWYMVVPNTESAARAMRQLYFID